MYFNLYISFIFDLRSSLFLPSYRPLACYPCYFLRLPHVPASRFRPHPIHLLSKFPLSAAPSLFAALRLLPLPSPLGRATASLLSEERAWPLDEVSRVAAAPDDSRADDWPEPPPAVPFPSLGASQSVFTPPSTPLARPLA